MEKNMLEQYRAAQKRIDILKLSIKNIEGKISKMNEKGYYVTDVVNRGKRGKKTIGTIRISGFPHETYKKISEELEQRKKLCTYVTGSSSKNICWIRQSHRSS